MIVEILQQQYRLVTSARSALFDYCEMVKNNALLTRLSSFNDESMATQLLHVANCYLFWLAKSALQKEQPYFNEKEFNDLSAMRGAYGQIDMLVNDFLEHFSDSMEQRRLIRRPDGTALTRSPFEIFTHVITHEFHHKGQVVNMGRQLGYTPVDTDVIRK